jgi:hypothetical protein
LWAEKEGRHMKRGEYIIVMFLIQIIFGCAQPYGIQFENPVYDFGEVEEGVDVKHTYIFKNIGRETAVITYVQPACVCTTALDWDRTVDPGEEGEISVLYKTPRFNGEITELIFVKTNLPEQRSIRLQLKGNVIIPIEIIPQNTWLGYVNDDTKFLNGSFEIKNNTRIPLTIIDVIPPDIAITYTLITVEEGQQYKLYYTIYPPFEGDDTVGNQFTLQTNNEKHQCVYPQFFYHIPPSPGVAFNQTIKKGGLNEN